MEENRQIEWIDRYLRDDLDDDEKARFEDRYRNDPAFAEAVNLQREVRETLGDRKLFELSRDIAAVLDEKNAHPISQKQSRVLALPNLLAIAAAITLLIAAVYWLTTKQEISPNLPSTGRIVREQEETRASGSDKPVLPEPGSRVPAEKPAAPKVKNNRTLALAYYQSPDFSGAYTTRTEENALQTLMERAGRQYMLALEMKKDAVPRAVTLFGQVVNTLAAPPDSIRLQALYLRGHAHFQRQAFQAAANDFKVVEGSENIHQLDALWYRALCLLSVEESDNTNEALVLLQKIADGIPTSQRAPAKELLAKVRSR